MSSIYNKRYTPFFTYLDNFYNEYYPLQNLENVFIEPQSIKNTLYGVLKYLKENHNLEFETEEKWKEYLFNIDNQKFLYFIIYLVEKEANCNFQVEEFDLNSITSHDWFLYE